MQQYIQHDDFSYCFDLEISILFMCRENKCGGKCVHIFVYSFTDCILPRRKIQLYCMIRQNIIIFFFYSSHMFIQVLWKSTYFLTAFISSFLEDTGVLLEDTGVLLEDTGVLLEDKGVLLEDTQDAGVFLEDTGVFLEDTGHMRPFEGYRSPFVR